ncbi:MAG: TrkA C-terminal domain-containing protein, partial [Deltaproteobacteria bacterium]|nr:TrkA C-terminal domain-containing protein [Deltaproteobacteria bacterium]
YNLLVAAGLAVMLSYIVQVAITGPLKYKSLYEQQVPRRADSPAHHLEHVEAAIHLLANHHISVPETVSHLDLRALLASGIALDLPDGKRLALGVLKKKSPYVGKSVQENFPVADQEDLEIVAVFREGHTLLPHSDLVLKPEDRLLVIAKEEVWKRLESRLAAQEV